MPWYRVEGHDGAQGPLPRHWEPIRIRRSGTSVEA
jgi:hypothetical protein